MNMDNYGTVKADRPVKAVNEISAPVGGFNSAEEEAAYFKKRFPVSEHEGFFAKGLRLKRESRQELLDSLNPEEREEEIKRRAIELEAKAEALMNMPPPPWLRKRTLFQRLMDWVTSK